jgi:hypothetical protein
VLRLLIRIPINRPTIAIRQPAIIMAAATAKQLPNLTGQMPVDHQTAAILI